MALPKLNNLPKYEIIIPSTQHKVKFRPYLVKEEKVLMLAMESKDQRQILNAVVDTIESCIDEHIKRKQLTTFDVEYLFTQIRSKSVGEVATVGIKCSSCNHQNKAEIKLDEIEINVPKNNTTIEIQEGIQLKMKWPMYDNMMNMASIKTDSPTEQTFDLIASCIDQVITEEEVIYLKDEPQDEVHSFLESLSSSAFTKIKEFLNSMPRMKYTHDFTCEACQHPNKAVLEGINDFF